VPLLAPIFVFVDEGGPGSGHWGHKGRKGKRGGAVPGVAKRTTLVKASKAVDTLIGRLKNNKAFDLITNAGVRNPKGSVTGGVIAKLDTRESRLRNVATGNVPANEMDKHAKQLAQECIKTATKSGWTPAMSQKALTVGARERGMRAMGTGEGKHGEAHTLFNNVFEMQGEWAHHMRTSGTQITKQGALAQTKGILTPEMALMCAINRVVAKDYYGASVNIHRGLNRKRKRPSGYMEKMFKTLPDVGSIAKIPTNSVSSWTSSEGLARHWTYGKGMTLSSRVSTSQNLLAYGSWWGRGGCSAKEMEVSPISRRYYAERIY